MSPPDPPKTPKLLLILRKEPDASFVLINDPGLPVSNYSPLVNPLGKILVVAPLLLAAITESTRSNSDAYGGFGFLMCWAANDGRHYYVILEKEIPIKQESGWGDNDENNNDNNNNDWGNSSSTPPNTDDPTPTTGNWTSDGNNQSGNANSPAEDKTAQNNDRSRPQDDSVKSWARSSSGGPATPSAGNATSEAGW